jgi:hypothetical protein
MAERVAVVAVVLAVALAGVTAAAPVAQSAGPDAEGAAQQTPVNESVAPGERMAGVVGAEKAAVESEVAVRAFERRVATADSSTARAKVVGAEVETLQARLDELAAREAELREAHENGTLSTGEYRARLAQLYAEQRALERLTNRTERAARDLPEQALRQQGVNATRLQRLRSQARNLTGPEVADIARRIAGKSVGRPAGAGPPDFVTNGTRGPGAGNGTGPPDRGGPPGNRTGGPADNGTGPPDDRGNDAGQGNGPPGNDTGGPDDPGNGTGPPDRGGPSGNGTDGPDRERRPPGNETGKPDDPGNGSDSGTDGDNGSDPGNGNDPGNGDDGGNRSDSGNGNDPAASSALRMV